MKLRLISSCLIAAIVSANAHARPVSYPGGWTLIQQNDGARSSALAHYSPSATDAIGLYIEQNWEQDVTFTGLQYNRLVKRWNGTESQANIYAKFGAGFADPFGEEDAELSGLFELSADWETRRWFAEYRLRATDFADNQTIHHSAKVGVAPYIGDFGDLHTWFMLQVENHPDRDDPIVTTPLLRFFKDVYLVEVGYMIEPNEWLANWTVRF